jgi:hypothetical protein
MIATRITHISEILTVVAMPLPPRQNMASWAIQNPFAVSSSQKDIHPRSTKYPTPCPPGCQVRTT